MLKKAMQKRRNIKTAIDGAKAAAMPKIRLPKADAMMMPFRPNLEGRHL